MTGVVLCLAGESTLSTSRPPFFNGGKGGNGAVRRLGIPFPSTLLLLPFGGDRSGKGDRRLGNKRLRIHHTRLFSF